MSVTDFEFVCDDVNTGEIISEPLKYKEKLMNKSSSVTIIEYYKNKLFVGLSSGDIWII